MTKKHFIALADLIKDYQQTASLDVAFTKEQVNRLADFFTKEFPKFNRERWIAYIKGECGKNGGKV